MASGNAVSWHSGARLFGGQIATGHTRAKPGDAWQHTGRKGSKSIHLYCNLEFLKLKTLICKDRQLFKLLAFLLIWQHVHTGADIHGYRADYAARLYKLYARDIDTIPYDRTGCWRFIMKGNKK